MERKTNENIIVPVCEKAFLTVDEAAAYTNVGRHKIREITDNAGPELSVFVGSKRLINRERLVEYLNNREAV